MFRILSGHFSNTRKISSTKNKMGERLKLASLFEKFGFCFKPDLTNVDYDKLWCAVGKWQRGCKCECDSKCGDECQYLRLSDLVCHLQDVICPKVYQELLVQMVAWYIQDYLGQISLVDIDKITHFVLSHDSDDECHKSWCHVFELIKPLDQTCGHVPSCEDYQEVAEQLTIPLPVDRTYNLICELKRWGVPLCHLPAFEASAYFSSTGTYKSCRTFKSFIDGVQTIPSLESVFKDLLYKYHQYTLRRNSFWVDSKSLEIVPNSDLNAADPDWAVCGVGLECPPKCPLKECDDCTIVLPRVCDESCSSSCSSECGSSDSHHECGCGSSSGCSDCYGNKPSEFIEIVKEFPPFQPKCETCKQSCDPCSQACNPSLCMAEKVVVDLMCALEDNCSKKLSKLFTKDGVFRSGKKFVSGKKNIKKCKVLIKCVDKCDGDVKLKKRTLSWDEKYRAFGVEASLRAGSVSKDLAFIGQIDRKGKITYLSLICDDLCYETHCSEEACHESEVCDPHRCEANLLVDNLSQCDHVVAKLWSECHQMAFAERVVEGKLVLSFVRTRLVDGCLSVVGSNNYKDHCYVPNRCPQGWSLSVPKCNSLVEGMFAEDCGLCPSDCDPDRYEAEKIVNKIITALNSSDPGAEFALLFEEHGDYFDSVGALRGRDAIASNYNTGRLDTDVENRLITLRKWFWDQKERTVAVEAVYSATLTQDRVFGYDNGAGFQAQEILPVGTQISQDISMMFQITCKDACGPLIQYMRAVQVRSQKNSTWTDVPTAECGDVCVKDKVCDPHRCAAEALVKGVVAGIKLTSTQPIDSIAAIKKYFTESTVFTGGGGPVVGATNLQNNIIVYACGSGPADDPHFSNIPGCANLPFYFDIETNNFAVIRRIAWDESKKALLVEWDWQATLKKPQYYDSFTDPTILQPGRTYHQDDIVIMYLNCDATELLYWREYFDATQWKSTWPCDWKRPCVEECCVKVPLADECKMCNECHVPEMWPCLCDSCCECGHDKSCARKYVSPALPQGLAYSKSHAWELRRMFNVDCVMKYIEWHLVKTLELPSHCTIVRRASNDLVIKLWGAANQGVCGILGLILCDPMCPDDGKVLGLLKNDIIRILLSRTFATIHSKDVVKCDGKVRKVSIDMLDLWLIHDTSAVARAMCRAWCANGLPDRCVLIHELNERLKVPAVSRLVWSMMC